MNWVPLWLLLLLCGCFSQSAMMTRANFDAIQMGAPIAQVEKTVGPPYTVHNAGDKEEYEYVETIYRDERDQNFTLENHYILIVAQGRVVGKRFLQERPPAYNLIYQEDPNNFDW